MLSKNRGYLPHAPGSTKPLHGSITISVFEHVASISETLYSGHGIRDRDGLWNVDVHLSTLKALYVQNRSHMLSKNRGYLPHAPGSTKPLHGSITISVFEHVASISWISVLRAQDSRSWRTLERRCPSHCLELPVRTKPKPHAIQKTGAICRMPLGRPNHCTVR
jgi:hypothetical protein